MKGLTGLWIDSHPAVAADRPTRIVAFEAFFLQVKLRWDQRYLDVEDNGFPSPCMMTGKKAQQHQVPLSQHYTGDEASHNPLYPVPVKEQQVIESHFLTLLKGLVGYDPPQARGAGATSYALTFLARFSSVRRSISPAGNHVGTPSPISMLSKLHCIENR